ncbi:hypothetical protein MCB86_00350 [Pseudomonas sp. KSR10]|jgi:hypothetical protein|uniref:Secreted protein n=1 Tax=Stutzerimonas stutzeri TaxID=316 RepID=A0A0D9ALN3_STUST|nr:MULTISPECIES: hypothetical protein [Pseudomonadaceae]KJH81908.1 hypothetical protein UF78_11035 [Stutzerimonas stutzeri]MCG6538522.1 hypothetical protein [Pseudomonas sp. KSR10]
MNLIKILLLASAMASLPAFAQWPAGTPEEEKGARPSPMGNPTPQETLETHKDSKGRTVTEDGDVVSTPPKTEGESDPDVKDSSVSPGRHSSHGGPTDPASDPGSLE